MNDLIMKRKREQDFEENVWLCERTEELIHAIEKSRKGIQVYRDVDLEIEELKLEQQGARIGIACFVSRCYPGGDAMRGGNGSEEILCRQSTLYPCLNTEYLRETYYDVNFDCVEGVAAKYFYIPDVVCTVQDKRRNFLMQEYGNSFDVIGCARTEGNVKEDMERMYRIARQKGIDMLVFIMDERDMT
ncbi:MAG: DUF2263 domain-containing protein [Lachnospiraceae bacterium]|nr:DUF2263 domain-containing protein [Lachnospiraceae bacterium]